MLEQIESQKPVMTQSAPTKLDEKTSQMLSSSLISIAENRDKTAFAAVFQWFSPKIIHFGIKQFSNQTLAQELLQETMTKVWRKAHLYSRDKGAATTWVYSIMRNTCFDILRKIQSNKEDSLAEEIWPLAEAQHVQDEQFNDHLMTKQLQQHLDKLPENQQQIIRGVYFQELSQEQLAKQLGIPLGTVKSRLRLALSKLKLHIGDSK